MRDTQNHDEITPPVAPASFRRRLFWLLACTVLGLGIGLLGNRLTSDPRWFLALPAALALGWLFFANPAECEPGQRCGRE
jgi:hypothetical protein